MKRTLLPFFCAILVSLSGIAQQFSPTARKPCYNCHPDNYTMTNSPSISDVWNPFGSLDDKWNTPNMLLPIPPSAYSQGLSSAQGKNSFVTLKTSTGNFDDRLFLDVSGFIVGKTYTFQYSVLSASVHYQAGNNSPYGGSAKMQIVSVGMSPEVLSGTRTTNFDASNRNTWITEKITFTAFSTTLQFRLSGSTSGQSAGYINFDIDKYPFECMIPANQVPLVGPSVVKTIFPTEKLNLMQIETYNATPETAELVWKWGPNSSDATLTQQEATSAPISNSDPANVKSYYAFYYAKDFNCYNVPVSQSSRTFLYEPKQVSLTTSNIVISCPSVTADLTALETAPAAEVKWFNNNTHAGQPVSDAKAVPPGDYYAFYFQSQTGSYSLLTGQVSTAHVHVTNAVAAGIPDLGPTMNINSMIFPPNGSKDFVVGMQNIKAENSNCSVYFLVSKLPGFSITYSTQAGQSNVNGGMPNNNDLWTFSEDAQYIKVTAKNGMAASASSNIGFKITRNANTPAGAKQNLAVTVPLPGGGGETNASNNQTITSLTTN